jgi:hypothetical protein
MAKKTWIKMKRGLLEPKHRITLGIRVWLYLYILDVTDWETGKVLEWRDSSVAHELDMPLDTIREQRMQLQKDKYISCKQKYHRLEITVHNWTNPREYTGQVYNSNMVGESADLVEETVDHGLNDGSNDGLNHGLNDGRKTPSQNSVLPSNHISHNTYTQNRKYTSSKSWAERKQEEANEKAADYKRYIKGPLGEFVKR